MTKEELKQKYNRAAADVGSFSRLTLNEDEIQDLFVDNLNRIYLCDRLTPYTVDDVKLIKYKINKYMFDQDEVDDIVGNPIIMIFNNGDAIEIDNISLKAIIDFEVYNDADVFKKFETMISYRKEVSRFQTWKDVMKQLDICLEEADIYCFDLQQSEQSYADIFFDNETLYISKTIETPYKISDVKKIKYSTPSKQFRAIKGYVCIDFMNGDSITLKDCDSYVAGVKTGKNKLCFFNSLKDIEHRYALKIKAKENDSMDEEFVIADNTLIEYNGEDHNIIIPEGVETIEQYVFQLNNMESIVFPSTLKRICKDSFVMCKNLKKVSFNSGLETIEEGAFQLCNNLRIVNFPASIKHIESNAFVGTSINKEEIYLPSYCEVNTNAFKYSH